jgi:vacuolar-type H+-ATPase subunit H
MSMSPEEKEKLAGDLKNKANQLKDEAENFAEKAKDYFAELKTKGAEALKEHMADAEKMMGDLFDKKEETTTTV